MGWENSFKWFALLAIIFYLAIIGFVVWVVIKLMQHFQVI